MDAQVQERTRLRKIPFETREQWLDLRRRLGVGGSEASGVARLSQWESPLSIYANKLGLTKEKEDNEAMRQGRDLEEYVAQRFSEKTGKKVRRDNHILVNDELPFMYANIDRKVVGEDAGLECKTTSPLNKADFASGDVPLYYYVQCQHYMAVTGYQYWYLAVLVLNRFFFTFKIQRNESDIESLIALEKQFWYDHVLKQIPPDASEQDGTLLNTIFIANNDEEYVPLEHMSDSLYRLEYVKDKIKDLENEKKTIENQIKLSMGQATLAGCGSYTITWKERTSNRIDTSRLKIEQPEICEKYQTESATRYFMIKKEK